MAKITNYLKPETENERVLIGHKELYETLKTLFLKDKLPHGIILAGESGIGKRKLALAVAKLVLGGKSKYNEINLTDTQNIYCIKIPHPDLHLVASAPGKKNIPIENIRNLQSKLSLKSFHGFGSFVIIDDAHKMTKSAANSLLKTLEEPSSSTYIFLVTEYPQLLPDTIQSRCHLYNCKSLSPNEISNIISLLSNNELSDEIINDLVYLARTSTKNLNLGSLINDKASDSDTNEKSGVKDQESQKTLNNHLISVSKNLKDIKERIRAALSYGSTSLTASFDQEEVLLSQIIQLINTLEKTEENSLIWDILLTEIRDIMLQESSNAWADRLIKLSAKRRECESRNLSIGLQIPEAFLF
ncbi:MAG TPA: AAA family ATPase [Oligoflexia bacterium]|nr:AAA family ATPase [Oligoflexia bacterium]HMP47289.1 AAA family ATPase [Oligoflexia bacterium]